MDMLLIGNRCCRGINEMRALLFDLLTARQSRFKEETLLRGHESRVPLSMVPRIG